MKTYNISCFLFGLSLILKSIDIGMTYYAISFLNIIEGNPLGFTLIPVALSYVFPILLFGFTIWAKKYNIERLYLFGFIVLNIIQLTTITYNLHQI